MANDPSETVIRKIQKLLELANRVQGNEEEAAAAMGKVQELLAQYNLDMAVVKDKVVEGGTVQAEAVRKSSKINKSAQYDWQKELWYTLASCNFCYHHVSRFQETAGKTREGYTKYVTVKRHVVFGREDNVAIVQMMGEYLCDTIERLLPEKNNAKRLSRENISWRAGCATRLRERLLEQRRARQEATRTNSDGSTGLALRDVETAEYIANYDALYGAGAHARAQERQKVAELAYQNRSAEEIAKEKAEEEKNAAKWAKQSERYARELDRKYNHNAFASGYVKGDSIGLDTQVSSGTQNSTKSLA